MVKHDSFECNSTHIAAALYPITITYQLLWPLYFRGKTKQALFALCLCNFLSSRPPINSLLEQNCSPSKKSKKICHLASEMIITYGRSKGGPIKEGVVLISSLLVWGFLSFWPILPLLLLLLLHPPSCLENQHNHRMALVKPMIKGP